MNCLFCKKPLSLLNRLREMQFCDEGHRQRYLQESRWKGVPLRPEMTGPPMCGLVAYQPVLNAVDAPKRVNTVRPLSFGKGERVSPSAGNRRTPQFGPETQTPFPLEAHAPRNAPRRRFTYRWSNQSTIREMLKEAAMRIRMPRPASPSTTVCEPAGQMADFEIAPLPLPVAPVRWQAMSGIDDKALESVRVQGFAEFAPRSLPQLEVFGAPLAMPCAMEKLKAETPLTPLESARGVRGIYIPLVALALLRPRLTFGPRPAAAGVQRPGVIIPIRERPEAQPLAKII